jgi:hypothetical protein
VYGFLAPGSLGKMQRKPNFGTMTFIKILENVLAMIDLALPIEIIRYVFMREIDNLPASQFYLDFFL